MSSPGPGVSGVGKTHKGTKLNTSSPWCLLIHVGMRAVQRAGFSLPHRCPPHLSLALQRRKAAHISVGFRRKIRLLDSPSATHFRDGASAADQLSLTNESHACLQGQQAYLERLEKSRNKISSKMKILFGHL